MNRTLYNNCPDFAEPDWSQYDGLEINCCATDQGEIVETCPLHEAEFFTVYAHLKSGGVEAITDVSTRKLAHAIAAMFAERIAMARPVFDWCSTRVSIGWDADAAPRGLMEGQ